MTPRELRAIKIHAIRLFTNGDPQVAATLFISSLWRDSNSRQAMQNIKNFGKELLKAAHNEDELAFRRLVDRINL